MPMLTKILIQIERQKNDPKRAQKKIWILDSIVNVVPEFV